MKLQARNFVVRKPETIDITMFFKKFCIATRTKKEGHSYGCPSFLVQALLLRKSGRLRADDLTCKGNPTKVSLAHIPFLAVCGSACVYKARETSGRMPLFC